MTALGVYTYRAARSDGALESGVLTAESRAAAAENLRGRGLLVVELSARGEPGGRDGLPPRDAALGLRVLAELLSSGLPLGRALSALCFAAPASWSPHLDDIQQRVRQGQSLAGALESSDLGLRSATLAIVRAGEAGGGLAPALLRAAEALEDEVGMREALRSALTYPAILAVAGSLSLALLVGVVLPRFAAILQDLGQSLPPTTRLVLALGFAARRAFLPSVGVGLLAAVVWRLWLQRPGAGVRWASLVLSWPLVGRIRHGAATSRAAATLGALLESGMPLAAALAHSASAAGDDAVGARLLECRDDIAIGAAFSRSLEQRQAFTPLVARLARAGEDTGRLAQMLHQAAKLEASHSTRYLRAAVRMIEPAFIIGFGGLVALAAAAMLQALYGIRPV